MNDHGPDNGRSDGRLPDGTFGPGNRAARGNPLNKRMQHLRAVMLAAVDRGAIEGATRALCAQAAAGDVPSIKLLYEYCIGRPPQQVELSGPDGERLGLTLAEVEGVILGALTDPAARVAVAMKLRTLSRADGGGPG